jgi:dTDP-glucose pyrophosphorylase
MKAVILAGGLGTRLSEETSVRPKPMTEGSVLAPFIYTLF